MRIIISPAKKMVEEETIAASGKPFYMENTRKILKQLREMSFKELQDLWKCNRQLAALNCSRIKNMDLENNLSPALLTYEGIQYKYMAPSVFENNELEYLQKNLRIVSAFYGVLKPMDGIVPYRLEMHSGLRIGRARDLYDFWGEDIYREIIDEDRIIINLASKEYSKTVEKYLRPKDRFITCVFAQIDKGRLAQKATYAKMARGEMVRYMAENNIDDPEEIKNFGRLDYTFSEEKSTASEYVFIQNPSGSTETV